MPSIYQLKPAFQNQLRPLVKKLASTGVTPNQVTLAAFVISLLAGGAVVLWHQSVRVLWLVPFALFIRMALNAIDGMLAREYEMKTPLGAILNELGDVLSDAVIYLPFALIPGVSGYLVVPVVVLAIISEMAGVLGVTTGIQRRYDGPLGKSDRAFAFSAVSLLLAFGLKPGLWLNLLWICAIALLVWTIANRVMGILREEKSNGIDTTAS